MSVEAEEEHVAVEAEQKQASITEHYRSNATRGVKVNLSRDEIRELTVVDPKIQNDDLDEESELAQESAAATGIQTHYRGKQAARMASSHEQNAPSNEETQAALRIQSQYRGKQVRAQQAQESAAATRIQTHYRGKQATRTASSSKDPVPSNEETQAALFIQNKYRGKQAREQQAQESAAATRIQTHYREKQATRTASSSKDPVPSNEETQAALYIQNKYRGKQARKQQAQESAAATRIQTHYRGKQAARKASSHEQNAPSNEETQAALRIQSQYRGKQARAQQAQESAAATRIQTHYRGKKVARMASSHEQNAPSNEETQAALRIQSQYRGKQARQQQAQESAAATRIQSQYRGGKVRRVEREKVDATVRIQSSFRGFRARKLCSAERQRRKTVHNQRTDAATKIQRQFRTKHYQEKVPSILVIQRAYRHHYSTRSAAANVIRKQYKQRHSLRRAAAVKIQRRTRRRRKKQNRVCTHSSPRDGEADDEGPVGKSRNLCADEIREELAANVIGSAWRARQSRNQLSQMRYESALRQEAIETLEMQIHAPPGVSPDRMNNACSPKNAKYVKPSPPSAKQPRTPAPPSPGRKIFNPSQQPNNKWSQMTNDDKLAEAAAFTRRLNKERAARKKRQKERDDLLAEAFLPKKDTQLEVGDGPENDISRPKVHRGKKLPPIQMRSRTMLNGLSRFGKEAFGDCPTGVGVPIQNGSRSKLRTQTSPVKGKGDMRRVRKSSTVKQAPLYVRMERNFQRQETIATKEREEAIDRMLRDPDKAQGRRAVGVPAPEVSPKSVKARRTPPKVPRPIVPQKHLPPLSVNGGPATQER